MSWQTVSNQRFQAQSQVAVNTVLRKTFLLLSATLLFSAAASYFAYTTHARPMHWLISIIGMYGLFFLTVSLRESKSALFAIFLFTGFMGYLLGPILNFYIHHFSNGPELVITAAGATGLIFLTLSAYALVSRKNFNYMQGFLAIATLAIFVGMLASFFFHLPILQLAISLGIAIISACYILVISSQIVNGGETNYIMATISLYVQIFNLFLSLLRILGFFAGSRD